MAEHFDNLVGRESDVEGGADVAPQRPFPAQGGQASHCADAAAGQIQAGPRPGSAPVVFAGDAAQLALGSGRRRRPGRLRSHIAAAELVAPPEQVVRAFVGVVDAGRSVVNALFLKHAFADAQRIDAGRRAAVPGIVDNQLHNLLRRQADIEGVAQMAAQLVFPL